MLYYLLHLVLKPLTRLIYRPIIEGADNVPPTGPVILASNHLSFIDSIVIPLVAPRRVAYLAKAEYFSGEGLFSRPRERSSPPWAPSPSTGSRLARPRTPSTLRSRSCRRVEVFGIYPEGTRSRDGRLYRGRTGVAWLAFHSGAPVVPVGLIGTEAIMPVGSRLPRVRRVTIRFGTPLTFDALEGEHPPGVARRIATDSIMDAIAELTGQPRASGYNALPPSI